MMFSFSQACKKIAELKLVQASSGNLSERCHLYQDRFFITPTGVWLSDMDYRQQVACSLSTGEKIKLDPPMTCSEPSSEKELHRKIYNDNKHIFVVLHCQPVYSTIIACCSSKIESFNVIPEIPYYIPHISYIDYYSPGSVGLTLAASEAVNLGNELVIMRNHGLLVVGSSLENVITKAVFFELACEILVKSPCQGNIIPSE